MNPYLDRLQPYPFEKLSALLKDQPVNTNLAALNISIGEPKHPVAPFLRQAMADALDGISRYPTTRGELPLRQAAADWLEKRFELAAKSINPESNILPVNGTREALFSIAQLFSGDHPAGEESIILSPNPFYQIYEGAAHIARARPVFVNANAENGFLPDYHALPKKILDQTELLYLCTPSNPTGSVYNLDQLQQLIELADRHDFVIASDECYSEIWYHTAPPGLLQAAWKMGRRDFHRCLVFHSLSKRSNMPGARSGFVAGDAHLLDHYFRLRTYTGCATPPFIQAAAVAAWQDESHVEDNRVQYRQKLKESIDILSPVLPVTPPEAGFYLWLKVPGGGISFAQQLYREYNVVVLPGAYLGRDNAGENPGAPYIRVALVATPEDNREAMRRIAACVEKYHLNP
ncbi:MAG: succinyldiaminopimelate transaminase [Magnetococcales bacterium]|nr:succinyldiaminopimelate transaminase [Magnetococcales bacterium]